jgi:hypothetical protein
MTKVHCTQCGTRTPSDADNARFCAGCGAAVPRPGGAAFAATMIAPTLTAELVDQLAGPSGAYYARTFARLFPGGAVSFKPSWNWSAALAGPFWLIYRRLYVELLVITVLQLGLGAAGVPAPVEWLGSALFGNALYFMALERRVRTVGVREAGGVNPWGRYFGVGLVVLLTLVVSGSLLLVALRR